MKNVDVKCDKCGQLAYMVLVNTTCIRGNCNGTMRPLKEKTEPVAEVPCSDGLCAELSLMLDVFNSCIETKTLPKTGSPCQEKIIELLKQCGRKPTALKVRGA